MTTVGAALVVAHRGSSVAHPEHTLAAYERAIDEGADGLECDVRLTWDGHLVCLHDRSLSRTSDTRGLVSESSLQQLTEADFGSWSVELPDSADELVADGPCWAEERRTPVLELTDLLALVAGCDRRVELYVETKHPTRYGGLVEQLLVEALDDAGLSGPEQLVTVMSFATSALRRVRRLAPRLRTVQLMRRVPLLYRDGTLPPDADVAGPSVDILRAHPGYVRRAQAAGHPVFAWTVDDPADVDLVLGLDVDAVITNRPADVLSRVRGRQTRPR